MRMLAALAIFSLMYTATAVADIYRWTDDQGNVIYSDTEQPGAEKIELVEPTIIPAFPLATKSGTTKSQTENLRAKPYESIVITSPADEQTIRNSVADIKVAISVRPVLQSRFGHRLQLLFDGTEVAKPGQRRNFVLPGVERGAHTLQAVILETSGQVFARSPTTTFFVHKQSVNRPP